MTQARILVVEDEIIVAVDLQHQVTKLGYHVVGVTGRGDEAVRLTEELRPSLVLMDIRLQGNMDGIVAAEAIRSRFLAAVVFITAHADNATLDRARITEPFGYLLKPFNERELRTTIEMALYKHAAEKRLRDSERRLATTLASIGEGVIALDADGLVTFMNPVAENLTGWASAEANGKSLAAVFRICNKDTLVGRDGTEILVDQSAAPIRDDQGTCTGEVITFRDVTEARRLEQQLRHSQKLESIGQLAGGIAHDFNNLLTVILCGTRLLRENTGPKSARADVLEDIERAGESGAQLTKQLLAFSHQQVIQPIALNLNEVVKLTTEKLLRRLIGSHIELVTNLDPHLGPVKADPGQLGQVLVNLAVNARDAMPTGGKLLIETLDVQIDVPSELTPPEIPPGRYRQLRVTDTGHGMDRATLARIFEPFFTTKEVGKGTGLGLATVYGIVKQSNGWICVTSEVKRGTTFRIYLPPTAELVVPRHVAGMPDLPQGTETLLLVEDQDAVRNVSRCVLTACGYEVLEARDGIEALEVVARRPGIDLVITDLFMPRMTGADLAKNLHLQRPHLKVLCVSGHPNHSMLTVETVGLLTKPFSPVTLGKAVRCALDRGSLGEF